MLGKSANKTAVVPLTSFVAVPSTDSDPEPDTDGVTPATHRDTNEPRRESTRSDAAMVSVPRPGELAARDHTVSVPSDNDATTAPVPTAAPPPSPPRPPPRTAAAPAALLLLDPLVDADARAIAAVQAARAGRAARGADGASPRSAASFCVPSNTFPAWSAMASSRRVNSTVPDSSSASSFASAAASPSRAAAAPPPAPPDEALASRRAASAAISAGDGVALPQSLAIWSRAAVNLTGGRVCSGTAARSAECFLSCSMVGAMLAFWAHERKKSDEKRTRGGEGRRVHVSVGGGGGPVGAREVAWEGISNVL